jgi:hypothetical protein
MKTTNVRPVYIYFSEYDHRPSVPLLIVLYFETNSFNLVPDTQNEKKKPFVGCPLYLFSTLEAALHTWSASAKFTMQNAHVFLLTRGSQGCFGVPGKKLASQNGLYSVEVISEIVNSKLFH